MQCSHCGLELIPGAAFCPGCGRPVRSTGHAAGVASGSPGLPPNVAAALCYFFGLLTGILFLLLEPYRHERFVRFHAFQSIFLSAAWLAVYLGVRLTLPIFPGMLWRWTLRLFPALQVSLFLLWLLLMYEAGKYQEFKLPLLGEWAAKQSTVTVNGKIKEMA
jgi:uncharacterized membrane protein